MDEEKLRGISINYFHKLITPDSATEIKMDAEIQFGNIFRKLFQGRNELKTLRSKVKPHCSFISVFQSNLSQHGWNYCVLLSKLLGPNGVMILMKHVRKSFTRKMSRIISKGLIFLIPKGESNLEEITQCRFYVGICMPRPQLFGLPPLSSFFIVLLFFFLFFF